jgi:CheY-like chemotaxis protein
MNAPASAPRILLIDSNVYFSKRLTDALKDHGFEVVPCVQAAYALTMLEWNAPMAILCATNLREMGALEMAPILRADAKTASIPLIAIGAGGDQALLEAYRAGCDDYVDRRRAPADIAAHVRSFLVSRQEGFQPTQMLAAADTALSGNLSHLDLPGVIQMLEQARQTGALNINAGDIDGVVFFEGGHIFHAECGTSFGDEAVTQIVKTCQGAGKGVYKFVYGATAAQRTVLRSATDLLLDALREFDEASVGSESEPAVSAAGPSAVPTATAEDSATLPPAEPPLEAAHAPASSPFAVDENDDDVEHIFQIADEERHPDQEHSEGTEHNEQIGHGNEPTFDQGAPAPHDSPERHEAEQNELAEHNAQKEPS